MENKVNYTEAQTADLVEAYKSGVAVEEIAAKLGKTVRSVVAKLVREGVYVAKTKSTFNRPSKAAVIAVIADLALVDPQALASLEKANREALEVLQAALESRLA